MGGGRLVGTFADSAQVISGEIGVSSAGSVDAVASTDASMLSGGDVSVGSLGSVELSAAAFTAQVSSLSSLAVAGDVSATIGAGMTVAGGGRGDATFAGDVS
eukprot:COSAG03_NODE_21536_length_303_cov_0.514706_1_plen_101_part_11